MAMLNPCHPGEILRDNLEAAELSVTEAAARLGCTRQALSRLLNASVRYVQCLCSSSVTARRRRTKRHTVARASTRRLPRDSNKTSPGLPGRLIIPALGLSKQPGPPQA